MKRILLLQVQIDREAGTSNSFDRSGKKQEATVFFEDIARKSHGPLGSA